MLDAPRWGGTSFKKSEKEDTGEKNQDVLFFENQFWLLSVWDLLRLTPWAFWFEIFTRHSSLCLLSFGWDLSPDSSHKIGNKFIIHHCQGWKEGSFVCETDWFFRGRILVCLTWNLSRFVPNSMKILMWNFRKKLFRENFSEILCKPRLSSTKTSEILPYFLKLYSRSILRLKKFTWVLSYVVCTQVRRHVHKQITKTRYGGRKARTFCFRKTSFVHSRSGTYYALLLEHSDVRHRAESKVRLCVELFDFFRGRILVRLTLNLLRFFLNSIEILTLNLRKKKLFQDNQNFYARLSYGWAK